MKAFKTLYQNGEFIDIETDKRVVLRNGKQFTLMSEDENFLTKDRKMFDEKPLDSASKKNWIDTLYRNQKTIIFLPSGTELYFSIRLSRVDDNDSYAFYEFICELLEDQYLYEVNQRSNNGFYSINDPINYRLANCICELKKCLNHNLILTENIREYSLNKLYTSTVQFYFSMRRSATTNVFNTFKIHSIPNGFQNNHIKINASLKEMRIDLISIRQ